MRTAFSVRLAGAALLLAGCVSLSWATVASANMGGQPANGSASAGQGGQTTGGNPNSSSGSQQAASNRQATTAPQAPAGPNAAGGDNNAGDVWVDNVNQPSGPGHEMDPHLACADINLWGDKLADPGGTFTIDGWPPSGSQEQDYPKTGTASWTYNRTKGGAQVLAVIPVATLTGNAMTNGDTAVNKQGLHFKLQFSQDPQKHKTFWINCPQRASEVSTPTPTPTPTPVTPSTPTTSSTPGPTGGVQGVSAVASSPAPSGRSAAQPTTAETGGVKAATSGASSPTTGARLPLLLSALLILSGVAALALARTAHRV